MKQQCIMLPFLLCAATIDYASLENSLPIKIAMKAHNEQNRQIQYDTLSIDCMSHRLQEKTLVIKTRVDFEKLNVFRRGSECELLPEIDFSKKILLAYNVESTGCVEPECLVKIEEVRGDYIVYVKVAVEGICSMLYNEVFWFLIDKPDTSVNIRFQEIK